MLDECVSCLRRSHSSRLPALVAVFRCFGTLGTLRREMDFWVEMVLVVVVVFTLIAVSISALYCSNACTAGSSDRVSFPWSQAT